MNVVVDGSDVVVGPICCDGCCCCDGPDVVVGPVCCDGPDAAVGTNDWLGGHTGFLGQAVLLWPISLHITHLLRIPPFRNAVSSFFSS